MTSNLPKNAFELLHPFIQEELYRMKWIELYPIQVETIYKIMNTNSHLIISAMTAGGKTEAAFLPILSNIIEDYQDGIRALYVGPLKALINDQFRRLEELCKKTEIPVYKWHGDVGQSSKRELLKKPAGVLLITPESIESLFVNHSAFLTTIFARLKYVVIDEMHSFIGTERGMHLKSLLSRISLLSQNSVRLIGLSATIGDLNLARKWLSIKEFENIDIIRDTGEKEIKFLVKGYLRKQKSDFDTDPIQDFETPDDLRLANDIIKYFLGKTALIFANSRVQLEFYSDLIRRLLEQKSISNPFKVHHSSLSRSEREETEEALRSDHPIIAFCSSTLEMGIDVGNIKAVGQIGAPWAVNSLTQRLGRSGRHETEPSVMWIFIQEDEPDHHTGLIERLFPDLLQSIAVTELMLQKWCEPPNIERIHLSTLIQQILSVIVNTGGSSAPKLFDLLITKGAFHNIDKNIFIQILRDMGTSDLIEQAPDGDLILGLNGERITKNFDFYSAFITPQEMRVVHNGHDVGSVMSFPGMTEESYLILSGRRWKIISIDLDRQVIIVEPSFGGRLPYFSGTIGPDLHPKVREMMRQILFSNSIPVYLDSRAKEILSMARSTAYDSCLINQIMIKDGLDIIWFTWTGSVINRTLWGIIKFYAKLNVEDNGIAITFRKTNETEIINAFKYILNNPPTSEELASKFTVKIQEKYDKFLSERIQSLVFSRNCLDLHGSFELIKEILG